VGTIAPVDVIHIQDLEIDLVHQCGRLQSVTGSFVAQIVSGESS